MAIDPFVTDVLETGGKILWSLANSSHNWVMWAFDRTFYEQNQGAVHNFYQALEDTTNLFNQASPNQRIQWAKDCGYPEKLASRFATFTFEPYHPYAVEDFNLCQNWMYKNKEIDQLYDPHQCIVNPFKKPASC